MAVEVGAVVGAAEVGAVGVAVVEGPGAMQEQALEILRAMGPFRLSLQPSAAYDGTAVGATVPVALVYVAQNAFALSRRPGICVALMARRQLSALQPSAAANSAVPARRAAATMVLPRIVGKGLSWMISLAEPWRAPDVSSLGAKQI